MAYSMSVFANAGRGQPLTHRSWGMPSIPPMQQAEASGLPRYNEEEGSEPRRERAAGVRTPSVGETGRGSGSHQLALPGFSGPPTSSSGHTGLHGVLDPSSGSCAELVKNIGGPRKGLSIFRLREKPAPPRGNGFHRREIISSCPSRNASRGYRGHQSFPCLAPSPQMSPLPPPPLAPHSRTRHQERHRNARVP